MAFLDKHKKIETHATLLLVLSLCTAGVVSHAAETASIIKVSAKKFEFSPSEITLQKGVPVLLELTSQDRVHGFNCPELRIRADVPPGKPTVIRVVPQKAGRFAFRCDVFCGDGHEDMEGVIIVKDAP